MLRSNIEEQNNDILKRFLLKTEPILFRKLHMKFQKNGANIHWDLVTLS